MAIWETPEVLSGPTPAVAIGNINPVVGLGIIHTEHVTFEWALSFRYLNIPFNHVYFHSSNMPYDCSRELVVRETLKAHNPEWIFFIDTDVIVPRDGILQLIGLANQHNKPVVSGLYFAKKHEEIPMPCAWAKIGEEPANNKYLYKSIENEVKPWLDKNALLEVDVVGAGCLLIKSDIFKKLDASNPKLPYFEWGLNRRDHEGRNLLQVSEDFYFCERLKEIGVKPHLSTAVRCDHICTAKKRASDGKLVL